MASNPWEQRAAPEGARSSAEGARAADDDRRLVAALQGLNDGFHILDTAWRFRLVNAAAEAFLGLSQSDLVGRSVWEVFPNLVGSPFQDMMRSAMDGKPAGPVEAPSVGRSDRRVAARAVPLPEGGIAVAYTDVTALWRAEVALRSSQARGLAQLEELEAIYEASPVGLGYLTKDLRFVRLNARLAAMNGLPVDAHIGRSVRDILPAIADQAEAIKARLDQGEEVVTYEISGETPAHPGEVRQYLEFWTALRDRANRVQGLIAVVEDITERKRAETRGQLLVAELNHRVKNTLAVVQNLARQSLRGAAEPAREVFEHRLLALAAAHNVLTETQWSMAPLRDITQIALSGEVGDRIRISGPNVAIAADVAVSLSLALHELSTNARKYGALSAMGGSVALAWRQEPADRVCLVWREQDGPEVRPPSRQGFGTRLLARLMEGVPGGSVRLDFAPSGLTCTMTFPSENLPGTSAQAPR